MQQWDPKMQRPTLMHCYTDWSESEDCCQEENANNLLKHKNVETLADMSWRIETLDNVIGTIQQIMLDSLFCRSSSTKID